MIEETLINSKPKPESIRYPGDVKRVVCDRLHDSWEKLADQLDIPIADRKRFERGREPHGVWEWLEARGRFAELEQALSEIGRDDLVEVLKHHPH
jgi:Death domain